MTIWTHTNTTSGHSWKRPLGVTESAYYWDGIYNGNKDTVMHVQLRLARPSDMDIYAPDNVRRAWASIKRRFPLLAAEVHETDNGLYFLVHEQGVNSLCDEEVSFGTVSSFHDAEGFINDLLDGPRPLSPEMLTRIYILRRTDRSSFFHVVLTLAHCITDSCSTSTVLRTFFQTLATSYDPYPTPIEERLQMYYPIESRIFSAELSPAQRRWRKAIGYAFHLVRRTQLTGGHTLPGNYTNATPLTPAKSRLKVISFPREDSAVILSNCRRHNITLNCAYHALSQVALSRVLCRRYLRGEISEEEWQYRKREPMLYVGMVNLRQFWDKDWFKRGGSGEVGLNFSFFPHVLPFMPLGAMAEKDLDELELVNGAPNFRDLMSFDRFLLRCKVARCQSEKLFRHPRFLDICVAGHSDRLKVNVGMAAKWRQTGEHVVANSEKPRPLPVQALGPISSHVGSSLGDMDYMVPRDYPMPAHNKLSPLNPLSHPHRAGYPVCSVPGDVVRQCETPRLHADYWQTHFRSRPGELYLGAVTSGKQLQFFSFYDENVHSAAIIREWLGELKDATLWYLGRPHGDEPGIFATTKSKL